ncbi:hypothetical protein [Streptomyces sp. NPDC102437]|uniref:hypothetical protein n=1 Tax=Streptomyces sp. NPDC102437 TaxID=3366175 RepID=UPI003811A6E2
MTREERRRLLGDDVIEQIRARVADAPAPPEGLISDLRRILAHPAGRADEVREERPAAAA